MAADNKEVSTTCLTGWIDQRFPLTSTWKKHVSEYYAPKNFNFWYFFGSLALLVLVNQIVTGIFLTMNYKPDSTLAFASVEYIMREVLLLDKDAEHKTTDTVAECASRTHNLLLHQHLEPGTPEAFKTYVAALHQLYLMGVAMELNALGYHMTKM